MKGKTLLIGIGNYGREDDGLGWLFLDKIKDKLPDNFDIEYRYQLQVEDAELITNYENIIFIDAYTNKLPDGYFWEDCKSKASDTYTSHELNPQAIVYLTNTIYNKSPNTYILGIYGCNYNLKIGIGNIAKQNLQDSISFFYKKLNLNY